MEANIDHITKVVDNIYDMTSRLECKERKQGFNIKSNPRLFVATSVLQGMLSNPHTVSCVSKETPEKTLDFFIDKSIEITDKLISKINEENN